MGTFNTSYQPFANLASFSDLKKHSEKQKRRATTTVLFYILAD